MSKRLLAVIALATGVVAVSGCVVVPAYPGYGYGYGHGYGYRRPPPAVIVAPGPDYRYRHGYDPRWYR
jgi:hypothetical protein